MDFVNQVRPSFLFMILLCVTFAVGHQEYGVAQIRFKNSSFLTLLCGGVMFVANILPIIY